MKFADFYRDAHEYDWEKYHYVPGCNLSTEEFKCLVQAEKSVCCAIRQLANEFRPEDDNWVNSYNTLCRLERKFDKQLNEEASRCNIWELEAKR